jgi:hypothetical protein
VRSGEVKEITFHVLFLSFVDFACAHAACCLGNADSDCSRLAPISVPLNFRHQLHKFKGLNQKYKMTSLSFIGQYNTMPKIAEF